MIYVSTLYPLVWLVALELITTGWIRPADAAGMPVRSTTLAPMTIAQARTATCPAELEPLMTALLRDLPSYINRVSQRTLPQQKGEPYYAIATSRPEFVPLPINSSEYAPQDKDLQQVFFTVLERRYIGQQVNELQHYHWLFLAQTQTGWRVALMFSRLGPYPANQQLLTPPRESSQGITAQAIRTWLNNCEAGAIRQ